MEANPTALPRLVPSTLFRVSFCEQHLLAQERVVSSQLVFSPGLDLPPHCICAVSLRVVMEESTPTYL